MTAQVPWAPGAKYIHVTCRLGEPRPDADDSDENPDLMTQGGKVTLTCEAKRIRYSEADGRKRMLSLSSWQFSIRPSDGELINPASGQVGVRVLSGDSEGVDPAGFTWTAVVDPVVGDQWRATIPAVSGTFDLVDGADVIQPSGGTSTLSARVTVLESKIDELELTPGVVTELDHLTDVDTTGAVTGAVLGYEEGTGWRPMPSTGGEGVTIAQVNNAIATHSVDPAPHPVYDDIQDLTALFENGLA